MPKTAAKPEKFTTKDGRRYEVLDVFTWTPLGGKPVTHARINMDNPATRHGWGGVIDIAELNALRANAVEA